MKFFHLSDLHLGLKLHDRDLLADQRYILEQIVQQAIKLEPDAVVIAGDIYDKAIPSSEAVALFDWFVQALSDAIPKAELMLISGNHDSAPRLDLYRGILQRQKIHMIGLPPQKEDEHLAQVTMSDAWGEVHFVLLPFVKPPMVKQIVGVAENGNNLSYEASLRRLLERETIDPTQRNVLVSHQFYLPVGENADQVERMDSEIPTVGNVDAVSGELLQAFDYAALGHIHKPWKLDACHRYCGTPLACSVSEAGQQKGIVLVEMAQKGTVNTTVIPLEPLHEVRKITGTLAELLAHPSDDYVSITLTDENDLDIMDMQDRILAAFPNRLEVRREHLRTVDYTIDYSEEALRDPFSLCRDFLGNNLTDMEEALLKDVINIAKEAN